MECNKFVNEKVGETDSAEFREHLAACAGCTRDLEELREVRALYREASTEKYRGAVPRVSRFRMGWLPMAAAAAVLLLVFGLVLRPVEKKAPTPEKEPEQAVYYQIHLEPWAAEARIGTAIDDCWRKLKRMEQLENHP